MGAGWISYCVSGTIYEAKSALGLRVSSRERGPNDTSWLRVLNNSLVDAFFMSAVSNSGRFLSASDVGRGGFGFSGYGFLGFGMVHAVIGLGGGMAASFAKRRRFWTAAVMRNSSLAPVRPRNLSLVSPRLRLTSPNKISPKMYSRQRKESWAAVSVRATCPAPV